MHRDEREGYTQGQATDTATCVINWSKKHPDLSVGVYFHFFFLVWIQVLKND